MKRDIDDDKKINHPTIKKAQEQASPKKCATAAVGFCTNSLPDTAVIFQSSFPLRLARNGK